MNLTCAIIKYADIHGNISVDSPTRARARAFASELSQTMIQVYAIYEAGREIRRTRSGITSITLISSRDLIDRSKSLSIEYNLEYSLALSRFVTPR